MANPTRSNVVLLARVDDPINNNVRGTRSIIVTIEHESDDPIPHIMEMAIAKAPAVKTWAKY